MKILLSALTQMAKFRPEGYMEDVLSSGKVEGNYLEITPENYRVLFSKYNKPPAQVVTGANVPMKGLGDMVAKVAQPIAKVIDRVAGTNVQGCGGCKKRQEFLNKVVPFGK